MVAGTTRNILAITWLAVTGLVSVQSELVSPPAQAQASENLEADTCLSGRQVDRGYTYDNTCNQPITVKYCARTPYQDCTAEAQFVATQIAAYGSATFSVPDGTNSISRSACTAREEHYWLKADAFFGVEGRYRCRPNAATTAEFQLKSEVWRARPVELSSPRTAKCTAVINHGALGLDADGSSFIQERLGGRVSRIQWSGACDVDGLISGRGTLSITVFDSFETWVMVFIGTADRGLLVGDAGYGRDNGEDEVQAKPIFFNSGCNNWNGARPNTCDPAAGLVERQRYLAASAASASSTAMVGAFRDCSDCPELVSIPAGSFMMGSPASEAGRSSDEGPQRRVSVPAFAAGKFEVTWNDYTACVSAGGCAALKADGFGGGSRPVTNVSWNEALAYTKWLSNKTGRTYRLLSEAEWEYAARAGSSGRWGFGDNEGSLGSYGWYSGNAGGKPHPVGSLAPNAFGLHDMHGNLWEWVEDCHARDYSAGQRSDGSAFQQDSCSIRVARGGSRNDDAQKLRSAFRIAYDTMYRFSILGFRVARTL
jgi:formylglycine-generating enzyme required for sulfatase activity